MKKSLVEKLTGLFHRLSECRRSRPKPFTRHFCRPLLECLSDRIAPAVHTWSGAVAAGGGSPNWSVAGNWENNSPPDTADDVVVIPAFVPGVGMPPRNSVVDVNFNLNSITKLTLSSGNKLILNKDLTITGAGANTSVLDGNMDGYGDFIIAGGAKATWIGGRFEGDPNSVEDQVIIQQNGILEINTNPLGTIDARNIVNNGRIEWIRGNFRLQNSGQLVNQSASVMNINIAPAATVEVTSDQSAYPIAFYGEPQAPAQLIKLGTNQVNFDIQVNTLDASFDIEDGRVSLNRSFVLSQTTIDLSLVQQPATDTPLFLKPDAPNSIINDVAITGSGKVALLGSVSFENVTVQQLQVGGNSQALDGNLIVNSTLTIPANGKLSLVRGSMTGTGTVVIQQNGQLKIHETQATQYPQNPTFLIDGPTINVDGTATWEQANAPILPGTNFFIDFPAGTLNINNNGTFEIKTGGVIRRGNGAGGTFNNEGTIHKFFRNQTTEIQPDSFSNWGTLQLELGSLTLDRTLDNFGTLYLGNQTFTITGAGNSLDNYGWIVGPGTLNVPTLNNIYGHIELGGAAGGILTLNGNYFSNEGEIQLRIGGLNAYDQFVVNGTVDLTQGGTMTVNLVGGYVPNPGQRFRIMTFNSHNGDFSIENLPPGSGSDIGDTFYEVAW